MAKINRNLITMIRREWNAVTQAKSSVKSVQNTLNPIVNDAEKFVGDTLNLSPKSIIQKLCSELGIKQAKVPTISSGNTFLEYMPNDFKEIIFDLNGSKFVLQKECEILDGFKNIKYIVFNEKQEKVGFLAGHIYKNLGNEKIFFTNFIKTECSTVERIKGLGTKVTELAKMHAAQNGCSRMNLMAAENAHMFHSKMGYRVNYMKIEEGVETLVKIQQSGKYPEYDKLITSVIEEKNIENINSLIDIIFYKSNRLGIRSKEIGLQHHNVPMTMII